MLDAASTSASTADVSNATEPVANQAASFSTTRTTAVARLTRLANFRSLEPGAPCSCILSTVKALRLDDIEGNVKLLKYFIVLWGILQKVA